MFDRKLSEIQHYDSCGVTNVDEARQIASKVGPALQGLNPLSQIEMFVKIDGHQGVTT